MLRLQFESSETAICNFETVNIPVTSCMKLIDNLKDMTRNFAGHQTVLAHFHAFS